MVRGGWMEIKDVVLLGLNLHVYKGSLLEWNLAHRVISLCFRGQKPLFLIFILSYATGRILERTCNGLLLT